MSKNHEFQGNATYLENEKEKKIKILQIHCLNKKFEQILLRNANAMLKPTTHKRLK